MSLRPVLVHVTPEAADKVKFSPRLIPAINALARGKFTAASAAKADHRHPGVPLSEMVKEAKTLAVELKETVSAIEEAIDASDPQRAVIYRILGLLG